MIRSRSMRPALCRAVWCLVVSLTTGLGCKPQASKRHEVSPHDPRSPELTDRQNALRAELDAIPSVVTAPRLELAVAGAGISRYRYRVDLAKRGDCRDESSYTSARATAQPLTIDLQALPLGDLRLCVVGGDEAGHWQAFAAATERAFTNASDDVFDDGQIALAVAATRGSLDAVEPFLLVKPRDGGKWQAIALGKNRPEASQVKGRLWPIRLASGNELIWATEGPAQLLGPSTDTLISLRGRRDSADWDWSPLAVTSHGGPLTVARPALAADGERVHLAWTWRRGNESILSYGMGSASAPLSETTELARSSDDTIGPVSLGASEGSDEAVIYFALHGEMHATRKAATTEPWVNGAALGLEPCNQITYLEARRSSLGDTVLAYLCTVKSGRRSRCDLKLATHHGELSSGPWQEASVAELARDRACSPFLSDQPSLALDERGNAHLVYRSDGSGGALVYRVQAAPGALDFSEPTHVTEPRESRKPTGMRPQFASLVVARGGSPVVTFLDRGRVFVARRTTRGHWRSEAAEWQKPAQAEGWLALGQATEQE